MVFKVVISASAVYAAVTGSPVYPSSTYSAPVPRSFKYNVNDPYTYDVKGQREYNNENDYVKGFYSLLEINGSTRTDEYTTDDRSGFNAVVKNESKVLSYSTPAHEAPYGVPDF
ncbi:cuticle protein 8-like [Melanaphis sacchari]|uniref:cuticle protein 8-like n=1 Tax=Melanaphis sacchari TaxID=742174 RepID=UPI000DC15933|nr:cuticle protein 8-like [Melanaphis sacchari]